VTELWIHFNFLCGSLTQKEITKSFRPKILEWRTEGLVKGEVITYHYGRGQIESLYVCLNIPIVKIPSVRTTFLSEETINEIPSKIMSKIDKIRKENPETNLEYRDYEFDIQEAKVKEESQGKSYYDGAPVEEILRFASIGTKIALEIFETLRTNPEKLNSDIILSQYVIQRLRGELGENYQWMNWALHFTCNPLQANEQYVWTLGTTGALSFNLKRTRNLVDYLVSQV